MLEVTPLYQLLRSWPPGSIVHAPVLRTVSKKDFSANVGLPLLFNSYILPCNTPISPTTEDISILNVTQSSTVNCVYNVTMLWLAKRGHHNVPQWPLFQGLNWTATWPASHFIPRRGTGLQWWPPLPALAWRVFITIRLNGARKHLNILYRTLLCGTLPKWVEGLIIASRSNYLRPSF